MPFTPASPWVNDPAGTTKLNATRLNAAHAEVAAYADTLVTRVISAGNLGATEVVALTGVEDVLLVGTVDANVTITFSGYAAGANITLDLTCDATSRTVTVPAGLLPAGSGTTFTLAPLDHVVLTYYATSGSVVRGFAAGQGEAEYSMAPADHLLLAWTAQPDLCAQVQAPIAGRAHLSRMKVPRTVTLASLQYVVTTAAVNGAAQGGSRDYISGIPSLPEIKTGACLSWAWLANTTPPS